MLEEEELFSGVETSFQADFSDDRLNDSVSDECLEQENTVSLMSLKGNDAFVSNTDLLIDGVEEKVQSDPHVSEENSMPDQPFEALMDADKREKIADIDTTDAETLDPGGSLEPAHSANVSTYSNSSLEPAHSANTSKCLDENTEESYQNYSSDSKIASVRDQVDAAKQFVSTVHCDYPREESKEEDKQLSNIY